MKIPCLIPALLMAASCSLARPQPIPYPTGVLFPLEEASRLSHHGRIVGSLVAGEDGRLYFSTDKGLVYCLEGREGRKLWEFANPSPFGCAPALREGNIFIWDLDNAILSLDAQGRARWSVKIPEKLSSGVAVDQDRVYVGTQTGSLIVLEQADGRLAWRFEAGWPIDADPVFWDALVIAGSANGSLNFIDRRGRSRGTLELGASLRVTPLVDGDRLYAGTEDSVFHCLNLKTRKRKWKFRIGGRLLSPPLVDEKTVFFPASNSVLYAVDKGRGEIKWWWIMPARSPYRPGLAGDRILTTSFSPLFVCLDKKTGGEVGKVDLRAEARSNPAFLDPHLIVPVSDPVPDEGQIVFLRKKTAVEISSSPSSPQPASSEISFAASTVGFHLPRFEFALSQGGETSVVQPESEKNTWVWFAEKEGKFTVEVRVRDEKQTGKAGIEFLITKRKERSNEKGRGPCAGQDASEK